MTDKEFKWLSRAQLIEIIYQLQLNMEKLTEENQQLKAALEDKRLRMDKAGNIADAAVQINDCFSSAQKAAEQYLKEIQTLREETEAQRQKILDAAQAEADQILKNAQISKEEARKLAIETILKEYGHSTADNG